MTEQTPGESKRHPYELSLNGDSHRKLEGVNWDNYVIHVVNFDDGVPRTMGVSVAACFGRQLALLYYVASLAGSSS